jgi:hypothetical protein
MRGWICIFCGVISLLAQVSYAEPILSASTENSTQDEQIPLPGVIRVLLKSFDKGDFERLNGCMADEKIQKGAYERLFRSAALPSLTKGETLYFVRPALEPFCRAFYGAHLFRYWLIVENEQKTSKTYKIRYAGVADEFEVFSSSSSGSYDIAETNCNAVNCGTVVMKFNGQRYMSFKCSEKIIQVDGGGLEKAVPCNR